MGDFYPDRSANGLLMSHAKQHSSIFSIGSPAADRHLHRPFVNRAATQKLTTEVLTQHVAGELC